MVAYANYPVGLTVCNYLRKSRADLEAEARGEGETLAKHRRALMEITESQGYIVTDTFEEIVSGERILDRPEMQKLLKSVESGKYQAVLCMDIDRLGRGNMIDQGLIQEAFKSSGTLIITPRKVYDLKNELDEQWSEFESFMARQEYRTITRRMQRGRRASAKEGKSISKRPPYGYLRDENLKLYPDPEKAPIVKLIFEMLADGEGFHTVKNYLFDHNILTPTGKKFWHTSVLRWMIDNPIYRGHMVWGRQNYLKSAQGGYERIDVDSEDWILVENTHEPLLDEVTYQRILKQVDSNRPSHFTKKHDPANAFAALVYCSKCGRAIRYQKRYNRPTNGLICNTRGCDTKGTRYEYFEEKVLESLNDIFNGMIAEQEMSTKRKKNEQDTKTKIIQSNIASITKEIKELQEQMSTLYEFLEKRIYTPEVFQERSGVLNNRMAEKKEQLSKLEIELASIASADRRVNEFIPKMKQVLANYHQIDDVAERNNLLRIIINKITYTRESDWKGKYNFELNFDLKF